MLKPGYGLSSSEPWKVQMLRPSLLSQEQGSTFGPRLSLRIYGGPYWESNGTGSKCAGLRQPDQFWIQVDVFQRSLVEVRRFALVLSAPARLASTGHIPPQWAVRTVPLG